jgi:hypothetical protein
MSLNDGRREFAAAAKALNEAGDKALRREVYAAFRRAAKPLGERIIREGAGGLPARGGLAGRVARAKVQQSNSTRGRNPGVALKFKTVPNSQGQSYDLKTMDEGVVRHPTFGRRNQWRVTRVRPQLFTTPFEAGREDVATEVIAAMRHVADQIARNSTRG